MHEWFIVDTLSIASVWTKLKRENLLAAVTLGRPGGGLAGNEDTSSSTGGGGRLARAKANSAAVTGRGMRDTSWG